MTASAEVFTVTSNADAGANTLRDALKSAASNGIIEKDFIYFNLPDQSENGRTIRLLSQLPDITSNVTIDASGQQGNFFGISSTKVQLITDFTSATSVYGLTLIGVQDVEIYGLYIRNFKPVIQSSKFGYLQGIVIRNCRNIKLGAQGKGNVISGFTYDVSLNLHLDGGQVSFYSINFEMKDCFIGVEADGNTRSSIESNIFTLYFTYGDVQIGGNVNEGNLLPRGINFHQLNSNNYTGPNVEIYNTPATINIRNNKVGTNSAGDVGLTKSNGIRIGTSNPGGKNTVNIEDNVISSEGYGIYVINNGLPVTIKRNYIGVDKSLTKKLPMGTGIFIYWNDGIVIGGEDPADANYIAYCKPINIWPYSTAVVRKNSFFCTVDAFPMIFESNGTRPITKIAILQSSATKVSGTATPNAVVDLYYADFCGTCAPETYFATVPVDAAGNWEYNGTLTRSVIAAATFNGFTSEFTRTRIDVTNVKITNTCAANGSIKGAIPMSAKNIVWLDEQGNAVGYDPDLLNVPVGKYKLVATNGECNAETNYFEIRKSIVLSDGNISKINPSCGNPTGSVTRLSLINNSNTQLKFEWKDAGGSVVAQTLDLTAKKAGTYTLTISTADNNCVETYGPITLMNTSGPNINEVGVNSTPSSCKVATGEITGLAVTGTGALSYKWKNQQGIVVATALELKNQPKGIYILEVTDNSGCRAITSSAIPISEINGITLTDNGTPQSATCGNANGSITGIIVAGADTYKWYNKNNVLVAQTTDAFLSNMVAGDYYLVAANNSCERESKLYTIGNIVNTTDYGSRTELVQNAKCGYNNGSIILNFTATPPVKYRWVNKSSGLSVGTNMNSIGNLDIGTYQLFGADANNCEKLVGEYIIDREPEIDFDDSRLLVQDDNCGLGKGGVSGLSVTGKSPFTYRWTDKSGKIIGSNLFITGLFSGVYKLNIEDAVGCQKSISYTISNENKELPGPSIRDVQTCGPGAIVVAVDNPDSKYGYRIYEDLTSNRPLDDQSSGRFTVSVKGNRNFYISKYNGDCESNRVEMKIVVGYSNLKIPNGFTPNSDGINDYWIIAGTENYPKLRVFLYNRNGAKVYENLNYRNDFNGIVGGETLAVGTYYYTITANDGCNPISGSVTIIR